jgi:hypothetical protein
MDKLYLENEGEQSRDGSEDPNVEMSIKIVNVLDKISSEHNKNNSSKSTIQQLKKVYICGASSYYPENNNLGKDKNIWALARVNMFLRFKSGEQVFAKKTEQSAAENQKISALILEDGKTEKRRNITGFLDISYAWSPSEEDFLKAEKISKENDLDNIEKVEDLYLGEYQPIQLQWD